jgi:hypothetical protein
MKLATILLASSAAVYSQSIPFPGPAMAAAAAYPPTWITVASGHYTAKANATGGSAAVTTDPIVTTGDNACYVAVSAYAQKVTTTVTITDSPNGTFTDSSNTYTAVPNSLSGARNADIGLFYVKGLRVGANHRFRASNGSYSGIAVLCVAGTNTAGGADQYTYDNNGGSGCSATTICQTHPSVTPTTSGQILVTAAADDAVNISSINSSYNLVAAAGFSNGKSLAVGIAYLVQAAASATQPIWTVAGSSGIGVAIASFK